jgi:hypothetical protein
MELSFNSEIILTAGFFYTWRKNGIDEAAIPAQQMVAAIVATRTAAAIKTAAAATQIAVAATPTNQVEVARAEVGAVATALDVDEAVVVATTVEATRTTIMADGTGNRTVIASR